MVPASPTRQAPFALRVVDRKGGTAAVIYRRQANNPGRDRLRRVAALSPLCFGAAAMMLRQAVLAGRNEAKAGQRSEDVLSRGAFHPLDADWGARVACYGLLAAGLRDGERLLLAAKHIRHTPGDQAAWWLGLLGQVDNTRALRAFRILMEAVR